MRSRSNSSRTASTWVRASTSATVRGAAATSCGAAVAAVAVPGIVYSGAGIARSVTLALGPRGGVRAHGITHRAAGAFLAFERESGLGRRPVDDEAHRDRLDAAGRIERHQPDVVVRKGLAAGLQFHHHARSEER